MRPFKKLSLCALMLVPTLMSCKKKGGADPAPDPGPKPTVTYTESTADFPNPERGFYRYSETRTSSFTVLDINTLKGYRLLQSISNANYRVYSTLVFRYYVLDNVKTTAIPQGTLDKINEDMAAARTAGVKLIPRFVYTITSSSSGGCSDGICPPYGDTSKEHILQHISDLKPVLHNNADVIACVQIGFIGIWGEQYYTDYFGDPSSSGGQGKLTDANWQDRAEVLAALLDAVPKSRMVQVRYPQQKQRYVYGVNALVTAAPMTDAEAFLENEKSRIGFHNDCFLSGPNDIGTYEDYGNSSSNRSSSSTVVDALKDYKRKDSKYVVVGGETCRPFTPDNNCEPAGRAQAAFAEMHYSYINAHYNNQVNNVWQTGGCMDNIKKNLGYRFVLQNAIFPDAVTAGNNFAFTINLNNKGYASPYNARPVQLLLRKTGTQEITTLVIDTDIRKWYTGAVKLESAVTIPSDLAKGEYELLLNLPDAYESIASRPEFSIRLANNNVWEETTGYNKLNYKITVN
ncbi:DUF4832 domain-containing protein [Pseudopedobacter beijingensis]|uniref:DUF4832 domain-containing protein n=1 Tax=Pseudopedobacter beijingensis TaxID=1207056 RepID=A0ABW4IAI7_9SPHI